MRSLGSWGFWALEEEADMAELDYHWVNGGVASEKVPLLFTPLRLDLELGA
jgi:hypothetical protein